MGSLLKTSLPPVWISGELYNFIAVRSGHWYFSLKDEQSCVRFLVFNQYPFEDIGILCTQHSLPTSLSVLEALIALGAKPANIFVIDKSYSRCENVANKLVQCRISYQPGSIPSLLSGYEYSLPGMLCSG